MPNAVASAKETRLAAGLERVADAGEAPTVWPLLRAAIAAALRQGTPPPGTPELMALAHRLAALLSMRDDIPGLAGLAARAGKGKLLLEARRLQAQLA